MEVIAVANQKGGVGKTTTCSNLGIGLAQNGKRVLLIDADPQGSLTISLGYQQPDQLDVTLASVLGKIMADVPLYPREGIPASSKAENQKTVCESGTGGEKWSERSRYRSAGGGLYCKQNPFFRSKPRRAA